MKKFITFHSCKTVVDYTRFSLWILTKSVFLLLYCFVRKCVFLLRRVFIVYLPIYNLCMFELKIKDHYRLMEYILIYRSTTPSFWPFFTIIKLLLSFVSFRLSLTCPKQTTFFFSEFSASFLSFLLCNIYSNIFIITFDCKVVCFFSDFLLLYCRILRLSFCFLWQSDSKVCVVFI